jgi:hypothetical protein
MSNPDPKPGRWILPLIIIGMVGFTYFFVSSLPAPEPEGTTTTSTTVTTTTSAGSSSSTSTTTVTIPDDLKAYLDTLDQQKADLDLLASDLLAANDNWDNRDQTGATYAETKSAFQEAIDRAKVFSDAVQGATLPSGYPDLASLQEDLSTAASKVLEGATSALAGLQSSDTGEARAAAIQAFNDAVAEFNTVYEGLQSAAANPS